MRFARSGFSATARFRFFAGSFANSTDRRKTDASSISSAVARPGGSTNDAPGQRRPSPNRDRATIPSLDTESTVSRGAPQSPFATARHGFWRAVAYRSPSGDLGIREREPARANVSAQATATFAAKGSSEPKLTTVLTMLAGAAKSRQDCRPKPDPLPSPSASASQIITDPRRSTGAHCKWMDATIYRRREKSANDNAPPKLKYLRCRWGAFSTF